jgi:hypothetical protein
VSTAIYVRNRCPSKAVSGKIPEELWGQKRINLSHLRVFGSEAYVYIPKQKRRTLVPRSEKKIFVGYSESSKAYRLLETYHKGNLTIAKTVAFFENKFQVKNLGAAKNILGIRVVRSNNVITLDQSNYIRNVLDGFNMQDCKPASTPLVTGTQLEKGVCDTGFPHQSLVGCLMYI